MIIFTDFEIRNEIVDSFASDIGSCMVIVQHIVNMMHRRFHLKGKKVEHGVFSKQTMKVWIGLIHFATNVFLDIIVAKCLIFLRRSIILRQTRKNAEEIVFKTSIEVKNVWTRAGSLGGTDF